MVFFEFVFVVRGLFGVFFILELDFIVWLLGDFFILVDSEIIGVVDLFVEIIEGLFGINGVCFEDVLFFLFVLLLGCFVFNVFVIGVLLCMEVVECNVDGVVGLFGIVGGVVKDLIWKLIGFMFFLDCVLNEIGLNVDDYILGFCLVFVFGFI